MGLTKIQWCDYTYNHWYGCRKVAPECENCYIVNTAPLRTIGMVHGSERRQFSEQYRRQPIAWNRKAATYPGECPKCGGRRECGDKSLGQDSRECLCRGCDGIVVQYRPKVFCLSLGDWLDDEVPIEWLAELLDLIAATPNLDWLLLTKRPQNFEKRVRAAIESSGETYGGAAPDNVWIGVSAGADQKAALAIPAKVHFLSCEPMLGPMDGTMAMFFDWIIFGGESGKSARPCDVRWIRGGLNYCRKHGIAPFVKQLGSNVISRNDAGFEGDEGEWPMDTNCRELDSGYQGAPVRVLLRDSHGGEMSEWPEDLRVREWPKNQRDVCKTSSTLKAVALHEQD